MYGEALSYLENVLLSGAMERCSIWTSCSSEDSVLTTFSETGTDALRFLETLHIWSEAEATL